MKKIRLGNDFLFIWAIVRNSQPEDLTIAESIELTLKSYDGSVEISNYDIVDTNKLAIQFTSEILDKIADYNLRLSYSIPDNTMDDGLRNCVVDIDCFSIVPKTALADEADEFTLTSDMGVAFKGDSAFVVWQSISGNEEKTIDDYFAYLREPATTAAQASETLNTNITNAEGLRVTAEQGRVTSEGGRTTAEGNRVTAEGNRVTAEQGRVTAENSRVSAESTRGSNENNRISQETERVNAEAARVAGGAEIQTNKTSDIAGNPTSTDKYPNVKGVVDYVEANKTAKIASQYGFLPTSTGAQNRVALQQALDLGGHILVTIPATYEIDNTVFIGNNTTLEFVEGCTIKKVATGNPNYFSNIICSKSVQDITFATRNKNIKIIGNGLVVDVNGRDNLTGGGALATYKYMYAQFCLFQVDNFEVSGLFTDDDTPNYGQYFFEMINCNDGYVHDIDLKNYPKDGIDIICSKKIHVKNYKSNTGDDAIFIGHGWLDFTPLIGDTEDILIENWERYHSNIKVGNSAIIITSSWDEWTSGRQYSGGNETGAELCSYLGNVYRKVSATTQTATVAPTHTTGDATGADGITWRFIVASSEKSANVRRVTFKNCTGYADRDFIRAMYQERTVQSNVNQSIISNLTFDGCRWLAYPSIVNQYNFIHDTGCNYDTIQILNCEADINNYVNSNTGRFFASSNPVTHTVFTIDNLVIDGCKVDSSNNGNPIVNLYPSNSKANYLTIKNSTIKQKVVVGNGLVLVYNGAQFMYTNVSNCKIDKMERLIVQFTQIGTVAPSITQYVTLMNNVFTNCKYIFGWNSGYYGFVKITGYNNICIGLTDALFTSVTTGAAQLLVDNWRAGNIGSSQLNAGLANKYKYYFVEFPNGTFMVNDKLIEYGANDSGGTGYKVLRILN